MFTETSPLRHLQPCSEPTQSYCRTLCSRHWCSLLSWKVNSKTLHHFFFTHNDVQLTAVPGGNRLYCSNKNCSFLIHIFQGYQKWHASPHRLYSGWTTLCSFTHSWSCFCRFKWKEISPTFAQHSILRSILCYITDSNWDPIILLVEVI